MNIALGTTSEAKKSILVKTLKDLDVKEYNIDCYDVESGIADQPLNEKVTIVGAINRSTQAMKASKGAEISIGLEGGLHEVNTGSYYLVCVAAILDNEGRQFVGVSGKVSLPSAVSESIDKGGQFGELIREYKSQYGSDKELTILLDRLISREHDFIEAIKNAFVAYTNSEHFL